MAFCLPKTEVQKFLDAVKSGFLEPQVIAKLPPNVRRERIAQIVGEDNASHVNALFEQGLLLERRKLGFSNWVKQFEDSLEPKAYKNIVDDINKLDDRILNPYFEKNFMADLAQKSIPGARLTPEVAKDIFEQGRNLQVLKDEWEKTLDEKVGYRDVNNPTYKLRIDYGNALMKLQDTIEEAKPNTRTWGERILDTALVPKTVETGIFHLSAFGVQGWGLWSRAATYQAWAHQFKYLWDQKHYDELMSYIVSHPDYKYAKQYGLGLVDVSDQLSSREEAIQSSLLQRFNTYVVEQGGKGLHQLYPDWSPDKPLPINIVGASSRAFTGFLNYQRFTVFTQLLEQARRAEDGGEVPEQTMKDLAQVVNNFSGRGKLPGEDSFPQSVAFTQKVLNAVFFAPRKVIATAQMFSPFEIGRLALNARETGNYVPLQAHLQNLVGSIIITGALLGFAKALGYSVDANPTSQDFLKIEHGGEKYDITGGSAIWLRLLGRLAANKEITARNKEIELNGSGFNPVTRASLAGNFLRGKFGPASAILTDLTMGADPVGNKIDSLSAFGADVRKHMQPIVTSAFINYYRQNPEKSAYDMPILASLFGINSEAPTPPPIRQGVDVWGKPAGWIQDPVKPDFETQLNKTGYVMSFPGDTIKSVKLTDDQYKQLIVLRGAAIQQRLQPILASQSFWDQNTQTQQWQVRRAVQGATRVAQGQVETQSIYTGNNIFQKSIENKNFNKFGIKPEEGKE